MSLIHCSPHHSRVKGNFCKVYSVNCFGQTGKRLKPTNDYDWHHRRGRFFKKVKNWIQLFCSQFCSQTLSQPCLFDYLCLFSKISFIVILCLCINYEIENKITISECLLIGGETENLPWTQKPPTRFVIETFQLITLAVCCGYVSNLIGRTATNIPEIILGVHGLMGFTVKIAFFKSLISMFPK